MALGARRSSITSLLSDRQTEVQVNKIKMLKWQM